MNIYFAGAIRGGREDAELYSSLIQLLKTYGTVLTEHVGDSTLLDKELFLSEKEIFERDMQWLDLADLLIAEVSTPSLGVGYELAVAEKLKIPCYCLFRKKHGRALSAMIDGNPYFQVLTYTTNADAVKTVTDLINKTTK
ncbi:MAG TPA: nucleoside 2-deoxyribosyltransferase [Desulfobacterales bacterium]|nr:nucleoside 2-deoxyribosyltransferase [Desulfobacterales bacterium]HIP38730.1 nucleoside 2-deoxyribosyltransferase [Desulfocapsa sulfexigens]